MNRRERRAADVSGLSKGGRRRHWLWRETEGSCVYCGKLTPAEERTIDHVVPRSRGGSKARKNLVPACARCNAQRNTFWPPSALAHPLWRDYVRSKEEAQGFLMEHTK